MRHEFSRKTKEILAKRSGFRCTICRSQTVGPSLKALATTISLGVAAHITAASPGGPRYDSTMSAQERSHISNGIWLCQNDATLIDQDPITWTVQKLLKIRQSHEEYIFNILGIPDETHLQAIKHFDAYGPIQITPRSYGFIKVGDLIQEYKDFINQILEDKNLNDTSIIGVLICGLSPDEDSGKNIEPPWTVFVNESWLQWFLTGQKSGFPTTQEVPGDQIFGQIPAWPEGFFDFLQAMVQTDTTFTWKRHQDGYLILAQEGKMLYQP